MCPTGRSGPDDGGGIPRNSPWTIRTALASVDWSEFRYVDNGAGLVNQFSPPASPPTLTKLGGVSVQVPVSAAQIDGSPDYGVQAPIGSAEARSVAAQR
jgi:hypothetical protein